MFHPGLIKDIVMFQNNFSISKEITCENININIIQKFVATV